MNFNIQGLIAVLLAIVIGVSMLPIVTDQVAEYDKSDTTETFVAEQDDTTEETFTVDRDIYNILFVEVEGTELDEADYTVNNDTVTLDADASNIDDEVVISYEYQIEVGGAVDALVDLLPIMFVVIIVTGAVAYIRVR